MIAGKPSHFAIGSSTGASAAGRNVHIYTTSQNLQVSKTVIMHTGIHEEAFERRPPR